MCDCQACKDFRTSLAEAPLKSVRALEQALSRDVAKLTEGLEMVRAELISRTT